MSGNSYTISATGNSDLAALDNADTSAYARGGTGRQPIRLPQLTGDQLEQVYTGHPIAAGYKPSLPIEGFFGQAGMAQIYLFRDIESMLCHPHVKLSLDYYRSGITGAEFEVEGSSPEVAKWGMTELRKFWDRSLLQVQQAYDYGWLGSEIVYGEENGRLGVDGLFDFSPRDVTLLTRHSQYVGFRVRGSGGGGVASGLDLWGPNGGLTEDAATVFRGVQAVQDQSDGTEWYEYMPGAYVSTGRNRVRIPRHVPAKGFWFAHRPRFNRFYGQSQMLAAWRPYRRLAGQDGAEYVIDAGIYRFAFYVEMRYPEEDRKDPRTGRMVSSRDTLREVGEYLKAGGIVVLPSTKYPQQMGGGDKWEVKIPDRAIDVAGLLAYAKSLADEISIGIGVPPELLQASETGSGYSGRAIPLESFLMGQQHNANAIARAWLLQIGGPLAQWNFGPGAWLRVKVKSLLKTKMQTTGATGQPGTPGGQQPGGQGPGDQAAGNDGPGGGGNGGGPGAPKTGPKGGHYIEGPGGSRRYVRLSLGRLKRIVKDATAEGVRLSSAWDADEHPRGQPDNPGQFAPKDGGSDAAARIAAERARIIADKPKQVTMPQREKVSVTMPAGPTRDLVEKLEQAPSRKAMLSTIAEHSRKLIADETARVRGRIKDLDPVIEAVKPPDVAKMTATRREVRRLANEYLSNFGIGVHDRFDDIKAMLGDGLSDRRNVLEEFADGAGDDSRAADEWEGIESVVRDGLVEALQEDFSDLPDDGRDGLIDDAADKLTQEFENVIVGKADEQAEQPAAAAGTQDLATYTSPMQHIPEGEGRHVAGWYVKRTGPAEYRIETDKGHVTGTADEVASRIRREWDDQRPDQKRIDAALERATAHAEPDFFTDAARHEREAAAFQSLPAGTRIVSLDKATHGRIGKLVKDADGKNKVKLDGSDEPVSSNVEPLDPRLSWRVPQEEKPADEPPAQRLLFSTAKGDDGGRWITIGGSKGEDNKRHGGSPVFVKDGRIVKGHPGLTGKKITSLAEPGESGPHRRQLQQSREYDRAKWAKAARKEGVTPASLHQLAAEVIAHDKAFKADQTKVLQDARRMAEKSGFGSLSTIAARASKGIDADAVKGIDDIAQAIAAQHPEHFAGHEDDLSGRLFDMLTAGNPEPMTEDEAYQQAFDHLMEYKQRADAERERVRVRDDEPIPFSLASRVRLSALTADIAPATVGDLADPDVEEILRRATDHLNDLTAQAQSDLLERITSTDPAAALDAVRRLADEYAPLLAAALSEVQLAAVLAGMRRVAERLPVTPPTGTIPAPAALLPQDATDLLEQVRILTPAERAARLMELPPEQAQWVAASLEIGAGMPPTDDLPPWRVAAASPEPGDERAPVEFPIIDEAVKGLRERRLLSKAEFDQLEADAKSEAFAVAGIAADETLAKVRDMLAQQVDEGADLDEFRKKVAATVGEGTFLSPAHMEVVYRNAVQTDLSKGQEKALSHPAVAPGFPYRAYYAIHDDRVRKNHLALEKLGIQGTNIYRADDPTWKKFQPPWDFNDRCGWAGISIREAADKGIEEAIKWLETGVPPAVPAWVTPPDFDPPAGWNRERLSLSLAQRLRLSWEEDKHPRGQPENKGEFTSKEGGNSSARPADKPDGGAIRAGRDKSGAENASMSEVETKVNAMAIGDRDTIDGKTVDRTETGYSVWMDSNYGGKREVAFPNASTAAAFLEGRILGLEFHPPEVTGKRVPVSTTAKGYKGQDEPWTERRTGTETLKDPMVGWHYGSKLKEFLAKETCFYRQFKKNHVQGSGYMVVIPPGTTVDYYGDEVRVDLAPDMEVYRLKGGWNPYSERPAGGPSTYVGHTQKSIGPEETKALIQQARKSRGKAGG